MPPSTDGVWTGATTFTIDPTTIDDGFGVTMTDTRGLFVLHAVLLHTGKVLCFSGHVESVMYAPLYYLFDPAAPTAKMAPIAFPGRPDLFCCHYVQIPDGRILAAGGSEHDTMVGGAVQYQGSNGAKTIAIFDPTPGVEAWSLSQTNGSPNELRQGRWYPTLVLLPDERVAVFSGRREFGGAPSPSIADEVELLWPPNYNSVLLQSGTKDLPIYPGLHLAPNGRIYYTHTNWGQQMPEPDDASILIPDGGDTAAWTVHAGRKPPDPRREEGMSVLLPPAQDGKILLIGGSKACKAPAGSTVGVFEGGGTTGPNAFDHIENTADPMAANIMDTTVDPPGWSTVGPMAFGRINGHCVLLPDETVFICGGHNNYKWLDIASGTRPSLESEIFKPSASSIAPGPVGFRTVASAHDPRMYHSVALLLPDGRVWTAGGADANHNEPTLTYPAGWNPRRRYSGGQALNSKTFELYEPPYMHHPTATRPTITDVVRNSVSTRRILYGESFVVTTPNAATIARVALMRPGACTHHTDTEQRYVRLEFTIGPGMLDVAGITDRRIAPPGYYMLWIVDTNGLPCQRAEFIQLVSITPTPPPPRRGTSCAVATACFGSSLHPQVEYLQGLRREIHASSPTGRRFIDTVNRIYEAWSPPLAARLTANDAAREVVRDTIVAPVIDVIRACDRVAARVPSLRQPVLVGLLSAAGVAGVAALPVLTLRAAARLARRRLLARRTDRAE